MTDGSSQGLFVIVAVVIFGIFVVISYLLFRDKLQTGLASIFDDSIEKSEDNLEELTNIKGEIQADKTIIAQLREASDSNTAIFVKLRDYNDGLEIISSSIDGINFDGGYSKMSGEINLPDMVNGKKILSIYNASFQKSPLSGELKLPKYLEKLDNQVFFNAEFTNNNLKLPINLTYIGVGTLFNSKFTGDLNLPDTVQTLGRASFNRSIFDGTLTISKDMKNINEFALTKSKFKKIDDSKNTSYAYYKDLDKVTYKDTEFFGNSIGVAQTNPYAKQGISGAFDMYLSDYVAYAGYFYNK